MVQWRVRRGGEIFLVPREKKTTRVRDQDSVIRPGKRVSVYPRPGTWVLPLFHTPL